MADHRASQDGDDQDQNHAGDSPEDGDDEPMEGGEEAVVQPDAKPCASGKGFKRKATEDSCESRSG